MTYRFIDLYAGIGGFRLGFESIGAECVFTSEIEKFALKAYKDNFESSHQIAGDIAKIDAAAIPQHDILLAGFPCQPFSRANVANPSNGQATGFDHDSSRAIFDIMRILKSHRPAAFVLENVPNLLSIEGGRIFKMMRDRLRNECGYYIDYRIINSKHWVPQMRKRLFIVGFSSDVDFRFDGIMGAPTFIAPPGPLPTISGILESPVDEKYTLSDTRYQTMLDRTGSWSRIKLVKDYEQSFTLTCSYASNPKDNMLYQEGKNPRRFTARECARIMGFPESFKINLSDHRAYRKFGNAVVPPVVAAIAEFMEPFIKIAVEKDLTIAPANHKTGVGVRSLTVINDRSHLTL